MVYLTLDQPNAKTAIWVPAVGIQLNAIPVSVSVGVSVGVTVGATVGVQGTHLSGWATTNPIPRDKYLGGPSPSRVCAVNQVFRGNHKP